MKNHFIYNLKKQAVENKIPIIQDEGLEFLLNTINENKIKSVLEIGTAIGYSAINIAMLNVRVTTIEKDEKMYQEALLNISRSKLGHLIKPILADALLIDLQEEFDLIFIDGAKAQYQKFFEKYQKNLSQTGMIVCDNLNFHNLKPNEVSKRTSRLLKKLDEFKVFLKNNQDFTTIIHHIGDGISVSKRKI